MLGRITKETKIGGGDHRRDRIFFELKTPKKEKNAIGRFCHNAADFCVIRTEQVVGPTEFFSYVL